MEKSHKVVMIPSDEKTPYKVGERFICLPAYKDGDGKTIINTGIVERITKLGHPWSGTGIIQGLGKPQHIYLLSDDEIKEGDWFVFNNYKLLRCDKIEVGTTQTFFEANGKNYNKSGCKKVIASNDSNLKKECQGCRFHKNNSSVIYTCSCEFIPRFREDFVKLYANSGGEIDEVNVEYEDGELYCTNCGKSEFTCDEDKDCQTFERKEGIKLRDDHTVIISGNDTTYTKEDVEKLLSKFASHVDDLYRPYTRDNDQATERLPSWVKENLL